MAGDSSPDFDRTDIDPLVLSDEDSMVSTRKETPSYEHEGSSKRKKRKNGGTPRPACNWVQFSREFIKEYSASHPESSGLKVATKAASDAWKVMSLEEKEKYTRRAREVWDDYLSTAPVREPKPKKQVNLVTRCSPGRLVNVIKKFTPEQKEDVKSMGFGSLLDLQCRTLRRNLCLWLMERFNTIRRSLDICGRRVPLTPRDVELVMGLSASGRDVVKSGTDELVAELRQKFVTSSQGISVRYLEEKLGDGEAGDEFKRAFLLYAFGTLLCPTARLDVSPTFLHFLTDMDSIHEYNWAKFLLDKLVREVSRYRQGKQRAVGGCLLFLQLFYYETVAIGGPSELGPSMVPCLSSWTEENISEREKREKELGGYGSGEVICRDKVLGPIIPKSHVDVLSLREVALRNNHSMEENMGIMGMSYKDESTISTKINTYPYNNNTMEYDHTYSESQSQSQSACPHPGCNFLGDFENLSDHFSTKHWDTGRRFHYNCPLPITISMDESFVVLQAEEDGLLFLLNKGTENIGHTLTVTFMGSNSSSEGFLYYILAERGSSSVRMKSCTQSLPGRGDGIPPVDFLLVPFEHLNSSGELNLEVCISDHQI